MIQHIKTHLPETFVIAGNVGTPEAVRELENAGADATKVGIGPGKVCITKIKTGFGTVVGNWQLLDGALKQQESPLLQMVVFARMAILQNQYALARQW